MAKSPKLSNSLSGQQSRATSNSMMAHTNMTHASDPAVAPLYLDTTTILYSQNKINKKAYANLQTGQHQQTGEDEEEDEDYDPEDEKSRQRDGKGSQAARSRATHLHTRNAEDEAINDNSSMLMGMGMLQMGVVATQHIREEYDEEDDSPGDAAAEEYVGIHLVGETPPVVEGGAASTSGHGNGGYQSTQNTGVRNTINHTMAVGEVVLSSHGVSRFHGAAADDDDESNVNSDEQDEYLGNTDYLRQQQ